MGLIDRLFSLVFSPRSALRETVEVFRENAEASAVRRAADGAGARAQFAAEFRTEGRSMFDRFIDGLNRLPRPMMALGTLGLFVSAMADPAWFSERMRGIALVPEPLWWLLGAVVSFYFGARHQAKGQAFQASVLRNLARGPAPRAAPDDPVPEGPVPDGPTAPGPASGESNAALAEWRQKRGR
ncbi:3TM-type holin [Profundibacterium mesophilum]|uniref:Carboxylesterase n=1 Tax=Profundibacterium mesophilum KAUST100406-0324 TaxID=1037889 RepID=A0A921NQU9_9RHOB|nr:3TM-type holin [Profundibacterium mesophilum]KAF0675677.1 hypothetical protein PMES_02012 [Profundibacterium mesophilum KAUST100406-0324]